jgi:hypothetical protein
MSRLRHSKGISAKGEGTTFVPDDGMKYGTKLQDGDYMANGGAAKKLGRKRKREDGGGVSNVRKTTPSDDRPHSEEIYEPEHLLKGRGKTVPLGPNWGQDKPITFAPKPVDWQHTLPTKRTWYGSPTGEKYDDRLEGKAKGGKVAKADGGKIKWLQKAHIKKGALHEQLHVPADKKIPAAKLDKASHSSNPTLRRRANLAKTMKGFNH